MAGFLAGASWLHAQATPLQIVTDAFPFATLGTPYNQQLVTTGGLCVSNGSASSTIDAGALPPGLSVTSPPALRQWFLQGTPSAVGNFSFTLHVRWTHTRETPFQSPDCTEDAIKTLTLTVQGASNPTQSLAVDRQQIATTAYLGVAPAPDIVNVTSSGGAAIISVQAVTDSGVPWLSVTAQSSTTPAALSISYSVGGLTQGTYTGHVTVTITGTLVALSIPVTLQVVVNNQTLAVDRSQIASTYHIGTFPPAADTVNVTTTGGTAPITVQSATDSGGPWLSATAQSSSTPAAVSISYSVSGLTQGTYTGHVTVTITGTLVAATVLVSLQVVTDNVQLQTSPTSLAFSSVIGGTDPPAQSIAVTVAAPNRLFQAIVSAAPPNGKWLTVTPAGGATPATLTVAVTAKNLPAAVYSGSLTMSISGIPNSSVGIPVTFTIQTPAPKPTITAGGVVDAAAGGTAIAPGTWVSIFGTALSATTRAWRGADFVNGQLPIALDGVSVTIDGKSAAVAFISPTQINVLATDDAVTGLVPVVVKNAVGTSDPVLALQQTAAPALFQFPGTKYAAGEHADGSLLVGPALVQQGYPGTAAHVGETIVLFGTGFGATQPAISATAPVTVPLPLAHLEEFSVRIGGLDATVAYAGLISPGLYQFNVVVPQVAAGDQPVVAELRGLLSQAALMITIQ
jgi:uncharacterized protein (TIGR03437 family)